LERVKAVPIAWLIEEVDGLRIIVAGYNREKDRTTIEETFRQLVELVKLTNSKLNLVSEDQDAFPSQSCGDHVLIRC
jgi:hypothetical protein